METANGFHGKALEEAIQNLPGGAPRMTAYMDAIQQADLAGDHYWRMMFRFSYGCEAMFRDDPPKAMPAAVEFSAIYAEHPDVLSDGGEVILMMTEMAVDPVVCLPQIPLAQWEGLMEQYEALVKRYHLGQRSYWWQMCRFYAYVDPARAQDCFEKFWQSERDNLSDCLACEHSGAVRMSLLAGDRAAADRYAKPLQEGRVSFCSDTPQLMWLAFLEDALDRGNLQEAAPLSDSLYRKGNRDKSDLSYLGAVLRCWAFTDPGRAAGLLERYLGWTAGMWDQKKVYDFYKGAWCCCEKLRQQNSGNVMLALPREFEAWREDGAYDPAGLASWFYSRAEEIASRFDRRNGSRFFAEDLARAGSWLMEGKLVYEAEDSLKAAGKGPVKLKNK